MAISSALTKLAAYGTSVNWAEVENDATADLKEIVPSTVIEPMLEPYVAPTFTAIAKALQDTKDLQSIITLLEAENWSGAYAALVALVKAVSPASLLAVLAPIAPAAAAS